MKSFGPLLQVALAPPFWQWYFETFFGIKWMFERTGVCCWDSGILQSCQVLLFSKYGKSIFYQRFISCRTTAEINATLVESAPSLTMLKTWTANMVAQALKMLNVLEGQNPPQQKKLLCTSPTQKAFCGVLLRWSPRLSTVSQRPNNNQNSGQAREKQHWKGWRSSQLQERSWPLFQPDLGPSQTSKKMEINSQIWY